MGLHESKLDSAGGVGKGKEVDGEGVGNGGLPCSSSSFSPSVEAVAAQRGSTTLQVESEKEQRQWKDLPKGVWGHIRKFGPVDPDKIRQCALEASRTGGQEAIKEFHNLMLLGADPNACVDENPSWAAKGDPLLQFVLRQVEADPSTTSELVKVLIKCGASPSQPGKMGETPLCVAASGGHDAVVSILLEAGADKDKADNLRCNPLHHATSAWRPRCRVVSILVAAGARKHEPNIFGTTPLLIAAGRGQGAVVSILLEAGAEKEKANLEANNMGETPLFVAAEGGHDAVVSILLAAGADKHKTTDSGFTPLGIAREQGHEKVVALLQ